MSVKLLLLGAARRRLLPLLLLLLTVVLPGRARASFIFTLAQVGPDVVVTGSGTLNLTALTFDSLFPNDGAIIEPASALLAAGDDPSLRRYTGISGPASWGPSAFTLGTASSGDMVVIAGINPYLYVPSDYNSGDPLANTVTFPGTTVLGLGFVPGSYTYTWGIGPNADSLTVTSVVPEPAALTLVCAILLMLVCVQRVWLNRRKMNVKSPPARM